MSTPKQQVGVAKEPCSVNETSVYFRTRELHKEVISDEGRLKNSPTQDSAMRDMSHLPNGAITRSEQSSEHGEKQHHDPTFIEKYQEKLRAGNERLHGEREAASR